MKDFDGILQTLLRRGERALALLRRDDWEAFFTEMRWYRAAFHNFSVADVRNGQVFSPSAQLLARLQQIDAQLQQEIHNSQQGLRLQLGSLRKERQLLARYKSPSNDGGRVLALT